MSKENTRDLEELAIALGLDLDELSDEEPPVKRRKLKYTLEELVKELKEGSPPTEPLQIVVTDPTIEALTELKQNVKAELSSSLGRTSVAWPPSPPPYETNNIILQMHVDGVLREIVMFVGREVKGKGKGTVSKSLAMLKTKKSIADRDLSIWLQLKLRCLFLCYDAHDETNLTGPDALKTVLGLIKESNQPQRFVRMLTDLLEIIGFVDTHDDDDDESSSDGEGGREYDCSIVAKKSPVPPSCAFNLLMIIDAFLQGAHITPEIVRKFATKCTKASIGCLLTEDMDSVHNQLTDPFLRFFGMLPESKRSLERYLPEGTDIKDNSHLFHLLDQMGAGVQEKKAANNFANMLLDQMIVNEPETPLNIQLLKRVSRTIKKGRWNDITCRHLLMLLYHFRRHPCSVAKEVLEGLNKSVTARVRRNKTHVTYLWMKHTTEEHLEFIK